VLETARSRPGIDDFLQQCRAEGFIRSKTQCLMLREKKPGDIDRTGVVERSRSPRPARSS
jgi:hypothetical protein